ncbi:MAG TPA: hypothetical protein DEP20_01665 [Fusobacteria bacterium]|nr:hypothetical protein [Fusobacteriota bacterium]|tara:strand:+ start:2101 stop:2955 length:855 start_codon:yes stop_codon:yes gene_type:complete
MIFLLFLLNCGGSAFDAVSTKDIPISSEEDMYEEEGDFFISRDVLNAVINNSVEDFEEAIEDNENLVAINYADYNVGRYGAGVNTILHVICNTDNIDKIAFFQAIRRVDSGSFLKMLSRSNGQDMFPADFLIMNEDSRALAFLVELGVTKDSGITKKIIKREIKNLVANGRKDMFTVLEAAYAKSMPGVSEKGGEMIPESYSLYREKDKDGRDAIYYAVSFGNVDMVEFLISKFVNLNVNYGSSFYGFGKHIKDVWKKANFPNKGSSKQVYDLISKNQGKPAYK